MLGVRPYTEVGFRVTDVGVGAVTPRAAVTEVLFADAVIVAVAFVATAEVETVKVAVVAPPLTTTEAGTVAAALSDERLTVNPACGAGLFRVTVPVDVPPPRTDVGETTTLVGFGAKRVRAPDLDAPFKVAEMLAVVSATTLTVETVKVADLAPAAMDTEAGTVALDLSEARVTVRPLAGAALLRLTVPVDVPPPRREDGLRVTEVTVGAEIVSAPEAAPTGLVPVMFAVTSEATATVVIVKVAVVRVAPTVTEAGTVAAALSLARVMT